MSRHSATENALYMLKYDHLPPDLQEVSKPFSDLAHFLVEKLPDGPNLTDALRKLWESKNSAVFQAVAVKEGKA